MRIQEIILLFFIACASLYAVVYHTRLIIYPVTVLVSTVQYPVLSAYALCIEPFVSAVRSVRTHAEYHRIIHDHVQERSALLKELIDARSKLLLYQHLDALQLVPEKNSIAIAQIIYKQVHHKDSFFIIDKGSVHGLAVDMLATINSALLGRVTAVYPWYARIMPLHNQHCRVPSVCVESGAHGVFHGDGRTGRLDFISHLEPLVTNELVVTSGDGIIYPAGLGLGRIKRFTLNELGFLYQVDVEPLYDLDSVSHCSIISKNTQHALSQDALSQQALPNEVSS